MTVEAEGSLDPAAVHEVERNSVNQAECASPLDRNLAQRNASLIAIDFDHLKLWQKLIAHGDHCLDTDPRLQQRDRLDLHQGMGNELLATLEKPRPLLDGAVMKRIV